MEFSEYSQEVIKITEDLLSSLSKKSVYTINQVLCGLIKPSHNTEPYAVGDTVPPFELPSVSGENYSICNMLEKGPVVLKFFIGTQCPYCQLEIKTLKPYLAEIEKMGCSVAGIFPESAEQLSSIMTADNPGIECLCDIDNRVARQFKLLTPIPDEITSDYPDSHIQLLRGATVSKTEFNTPATYIINRDGVLCLAYINRDFRQRMEPSDMLSLLKALV